MSEKMDHEVEIVRYNSFPHAETFLEKMAQQALSSGLFDKKPRSWSKVPQARSREVNKCMSC